MNYYHLLALGVALSWGATQKLEADRLEELAISDARLIEVITEKKTGLEQSVIELEHHRAELVDALEARNESLIAITQRLNSQAAYLESLKNDKNYNEIISAKLPSVISCMFNSDTQADTLNDCLPLDTAQPSSSQ